MKRFLIRWLVSAALLIAVAYLVPGIHLTVLAALGAAVVMGLLNAIIRPILLLLTLPITLMTFGLFIFVINAILFWLAALVVPGFSVDGFLAALEGAVVYALFGAAISIVSTLGEKKKARAAA